MKFSTRILSALCSSFLGIVIPTLVKVLSRSGQLDGAYSYLFFYLLFYVFIPLSAITVVSNIILNYLFEKLKVESLPVKMSFTLGITLFVAFAYVMITSLFFGTFSSVFQETWWLLQCGILAISFDTFLSNRFMEKKKLANEPLDQNLEL